MSSKFTTVLSFSIFFWSWAINLDYLLLLLGFSQLEIIVLCFTILDWCGHLLILVEEYQHALILRHLAYIYIHCKLCKHVCFSVRDLQLECLRVVIRYDHRLWREMEWKRLLCFLGNFYFLSINLQGCHVKLSECLCMRSEDQLW